MEEMRSLLVLISLFYTVTVSQGNVLVTSNGVKGKIYENLLQKSLYRLPQLLIFLQWVSLFCSPCANNKIY